MISSISSNLQSILGSEISASFSQSQDRNKTKEVQNQTEPLALENSQSTPKRFKYSINTTLNQVVLSIIDRSTNQVIREIPAADLQKLQEMLRESSSGLLFDQKA